MHRMIRRHLAIISILASTFSLLAAGSAAARAAADDDDAVEAFAPMVTGDFNRDGIADIAKAVLPDGDRSRPATLAVLLGQRDGSFQQVETSPPLGRNPKAIVVGDFNGDGIPDMAVGDADGSLTELLGDGTGNLVPAGSIAGFGAVDSIAVADFNHDGKLDLAVSDSHSSNVTILLGEGNGTFRHKWTFPLPMQGTVDIVATADFNGDGVPDLAVTDPDRDTFEVMLGDGDGTFTLSTELSKLVDPNSHCAT